MGSAPGVWLEKTGRKTIYDPTRKKVFKIVPGMEKATPPVETPKRPRIDHGRGLYATLSGLFYHQRRLSPRGAAATTRGGVKKRNIFDSVQFFLW